MSKTSRSTFRVSIVVVAIVFFGHSSVAMTNTAAPGIGTQDFRRTGLDQPHPGTPSVDKTGRKTPKPPVPRPLQGS
jgi:hypothetical protein